MLVDMLSKEMVALDLSELEEASSLVEIMAGGCGAGNSCGGALVCGTPK